MATNNYEKIVEYVFRQMERRLVINKPHLIHIIQYIDNDVSNSEANEIIKRMIAEKKIDEHLALSKRGRPYSFYTFEAETNNLTQIISPLLKVLSQEKELSITDAAQLTGYSQLIVRTLFTHLLLEGKVDYHGDLSSPVFYIPWDEK